MANRVLLLAGLGVLYAVTAAGMVHLEGDDYRRSIRVRRARASGAINVSATRPIVDLRDRKDIAVTITVLDSKEVNAFSHLGGYIYVTRGLFNLAATEEEFRFVVGHELAHVDRRHAQALVAEAEREGKT